MFHLLTKPAQFIYNYIGIGHTDKYHIVGDIENLLLPTDDNGSQRQCNTYHGVYYISRGTLGGTERNPKIGSLMRFDPATKEAEAYALSTEINSTP